MTSNVEHNENTNRPANGLVGKILIGGALLAALGGWWYQSSQVASVRRELTNAQQKTEQLHSQMQTSVSQAKTEFNQTIASMNEQLETARREALAGSQRAQVAAKRQAGAVLTTLSAKNQELTQQIDQIKTENVQKSALVDETLNGIKGDVGNVKTEVATTRTELTETIADLKRMTGDMGVMSGLIATNSTELGALRKLGEKDYFEFTLPKTGALQRMGGIQLALKKADVKRSRFTLEVMADDKRVEKKDKTINEPVQFYTSGARTPYEVVVNEIRKNQVIGYLSVPKVKIMAKR
jgi:DNA repair exonuclease SbcCD ATPase subunit